MEPHRSPQRHFLGYIVPPLVRECNSCAFCRSCQGAERARPVWQPPSLSLRIGTGQTSRARGPHTSPTHTQIGRKGSAEQWHITLNMAHSHSHFAWKWDHLGPYFAFSASCENENRVVARGSRRRDA